MLTPWRSQVRILCRPLQWVGLVGRAICRFALPAAPICQLLLAPPTSPTFSQGAVFSQGTVFALFRARILVRGREIGAHPCWLTALATGFVSTDGNSSWIDR